MALVSGRGSTLNPNARPFIPAVYRQVEDFSSEWWNLVQNNAGFHDYWLSEHQEPSFERIDDSKDDDITNLLPDTFDVSYDEFPGVEAEFEEIVRSHEAYDQSGLRTFAKPQNGQGLEVSSLMANLNLLSPSPKGRGMSSISMVEPARYNERLVQCTSPKYSPRLIQQPR